MFRALYASLSSLRREGLTAWNDREIRPGQEFDHTIKEELRQADLILLLVSSAFLDSEYIYRVELAQALKRHEEGSAQVLPVILKPCDWKTGVLGRLLAAPKDGKAVIKWKPREDAYLDIVNTVRQAVSVIAKSGDTSARADGATITPPPRKVPQRAKRQRSQITRSFVDWLIHIHDKNGRNATVQKTTTFSANDKNVLVISDRNFASTGKLVFVRASMGQISAPVDEGGSFCVNTSLREPLKVGEEVSNTLTIQAKNTFTSATETFSHVVADCNARIRVMLPENRPAKSAYAVRIMDGETQTLPDQVMQTDTLLQLEIKNAPNGSKYILEWNW